MKLIAVTPRNVTLTIDNAELAVIRNALRDYASNHSYGAVMLDSMKALFELDKPIIDEQSKLIAFGEREREREKARESYIRGVRRRTKELHEIVDNNPALKRIYDDAQKEEDK